MSQDTAQRTFTLTEDEVRYVARNAAMKILGAVGEALLDGILDITVHGEESDVAGSDVQTLNDIAQAVAFLQYTVAPLTHWEAVTANIESWTGDVFEMQGEGGQA